MTFYAGEDIKMGDLVVIGPKGIVMKRVALASDHGSQWQETHDKVCTKGRDCASFGGEKVCYHPRKTIR